MALNKRQATKNFISASQRDFNLENNMTVTLVNRYKIIRKKIEVIASKLEDDLVILEAREAEEGIDLQTSKMIRSRKAQIEIDAITKKLYSDNRITSNSASKKIIKNRVRDEFSRLKINTNLKITTTIPSDRVIDKQVAAPITLNTYDEIMEDREKKLKEKANAIILGLVLLGTTKKILPAATRLGRLFIDDKTFVSPIDKLFKASIGPINQADKTRIIPSKELGGDLKGTASISKSHLQGNKVAGQEMGRNQVIDEVKKQIDPAADLDIVVIWRTMQDDLVRDSHSTMEGQVKGSIAAGGYISGDGNFTNGPREFGDPAEDANCRCEEETQYTIN